MIIALPEVLIRSIFSFLKYDDTLKVATLSHRLHDHVEAFSGDELSNIRQNHQVDSSWNYRLGMQVNIPHERQPPTLSNRHMLKLARQTHLYSLAHRECERGTYNLLCLPDGETLICSGHDTHMHVWDLTTQRYTRAFGESVHENNSDILEYCAGRLVSSFLDSAYIWDLDGTLLHEIYFPGISRLSEASVSCGNHVFVSTYQDEDDFDGSSPSVPSTCFLESVSEKRHQFGALINNIM